MTGTTNTNEKPSVIEKVKAKVENVLHKDKSHTTTTSTTHDTHTTGTTTGNSGLVGEGQAGPHSSRAANAADPRFDSDLDGSRNAGISHGTGHTAGHTVSGSQGLGGTGNTHGAGHVGEGQAGPHSSRVANAADPRFDSDLDGSRNAGVSHGTGHTAGSSALGGSGLVSEGQAGPHSSRTANAADPRFDSDLDGSRNAGLSHGTGHSGAAGLGSSTLGGSTTGGAYGSTHATPVHNSSLANKVDPRVSTNPGTYDNQTGTGNTGLTGHTGTHNTGGLSNSTNAGPHDSNLANKADPRVDSDLDGAGNRHGHATGGILGASGSHATRGSGTAQNTDGPHNSDRLNQLDPRVDSDRDASKTLGGNKTNY